MNSPANSVGLFQQAAKMIRHASESASFVHEGDYIFFIHKNIVFPAQTKHSYFSADVSLKIFL